MNTGEWIQAVAASISACAFVGLIVSVLILKRQTEILNRQTEEAAKATFASVYQGMAGQMHDLDKLFIETPELRPHFYGKNKELPDDEHERERVLATAELIIDFADNFVAQSALLPKEYERAYGAYFRDLYGSSLAIQQFWSECRGWYCDELNELLTDGLPPPARSTSRPVPGPA
jgi:hypothetical protein